MAKNSKSFLPKRIAGVKVPKAVRKSQFGQMLASPSGQKLLAEAIVAVGAIASAKRVKNSPEARDALDGAADKLREGKNATKDTASDAVGVLAYALGEAVRSFTEALQRRGAGARDEVEDSGGDSKKKPISYEAGPL